MLHFTDFHAGDIWESPDTGNRFAVVGRQSGQIGVIRQGGRWDNGITYWWPVDCFRRMRRVDPPS